MKDKPTGIGKQLDEAVKLVKHIRNFKKIHSRLRPLGMDSGHLQIRDVRILGCDYKITKKDTPKYPYELSFTHKGIQVISIHTKEDMRLEDINS